MSATINPQEDATTLRDTLSYAAQEDADPKQVWREIKATIKPYCQDRNGLDHLRSLLQFGAIQRH